MALSRPRKVLFFLNNRVAFEDFLLKVAMSIPSSSPIYTPIKRVKRSDLENLEATTLFPSQDTQFEEWHTARTSSDLELPEDLDVVQANHASTPLPETQPQEIPNSQWWEEDSLDSLPEAPSLDLGPDETVDSDTDDDGGQEDTQFYLRQILTESMVESLPLPPQQKLQAREILHTSEN